MESTDNNSRQFAGVYCFVVVLPVHILLHYFFRFYLLMVVLPVSFYISSSCVYPFTVVVLVSIFFWQLFWYLLLYDSFSGVNLFFGSSFSVFSFTVVLQVPILYGSSVCVYPFAVVLSSFGNSSGTYCFTTVLPVSIVLRQFFRYLLFYGSSSAVIIFLVVPSITSLRQFFRCFPLR
jgi:hypothetical protein